jgi:hypothetical protein
MGADGRNEFSASISPHVIARIRSNRELCVFALYSSRLPHYVRNDMEVHCPPPAAARAEAKASAKLTMPFPALKASIVLVDFGRSWPTDGDMRTVFSVTISEQPQARALAEA